MGDPAYIDPDNCLGSIESGHLSSCRGGHGWAVRVEYGIFRGDGPFPNASPYTRETILGKEVHDKVKRRGD